MLPSQHCFLLPLQAAEQQEKLLSVSSHKVTLEALSREVTVLPEISRDVGHLSQT